MRRRQTARQLKQRAEKYFPKAERKRELPPEAFDEIPRVALVLTDETMYLTRFDARGEPCLSYPVQSADVAVALNHFGADTGLLPENCLFWQTRKTQTRIGIYLPPMVRALTFPQGRRERTLRVPMPGLVFVGIGVRYWVYAVKRYPTSPHESVYRAPLPNVGDDGLICAGNVKFPKASAETLPQAATLFFESQFNGDLSDGKVMAQQDDDCEDDEVDENGDELDPFQAAHGRIRRPPAINLFRYLESLDGKKQFPLDQLILHGTMRDVLGAGQNGHS